MIRAKYLLMLLILLIVTGFIFSPDARSGVLEDALDNPGQTDGVTPLEFVTDGASAWTSQTITTYSNDTAAQSGLITGNAFSSLATTVTGPATISFYQKVSSQPTYDGLSFSINGTSKYKVTGEVNWQQKRFTLAAGTHTLLWKYSKNGGIDKGSDAAWVDKVVVSPYIKVQVVTPNGGGLYHPGDSVRITWNAPAGAETFKIYYTVNNGTSYTLITTVNGTSYDWTVPPVNGNRTGCRVKVAAYGAANVAMGYDISDAPFMIEVLKVNYPNNSGDTQYGATPANINYTLQNTATAVASTLFYYTVDGVIWKLIGAAANTSAGTYDYAWSVPSVTAAKPKCKVKVVVKSTTGAVIATDISDAFFTINTGPAPSPAKVITAFSFANPAATGTINEAAKTISVIVPYGTNVTALVGTFTTTGASVKVGGVTQTSGVTPNNFTNPVQYVVTAGDGTTATYTVTVTTALNPAKAITAFSFASPAATGTINETTKAISITVPYGTDVTALVATFTTTGASVKVSGVTQTSGVTANNFTNPVSYVVTAADSTIATYTATVTVALNPAKAITAFSFTSPAAMGTINEAAKTISATMPYGTDVSTLVASFTTTGESVKVNGVIQTSGVTANNFTNPVSYVVTAADGSTVIYTVTVTVALNPAKAITAFYFMNPPASSTIDEAAKTISVTVPYGTDVTALVASFTTTGASVKVNGVTQTSGVTANNFTNPVSYLVIAQNGSTMTYTVTVTVALSPAKAITAFSFASPAATGMVNEAAKTISVIVPYGTDVSALIATFTTVSTSIMVGSTEQVSGSTPNDFTNPVSYIVTAANGSTTVYKVTVAVSSDTAKSLTSFSFTGPTARGIITEAAKTISVAVPYGTDVTNLIAKFTTTGASVTVSGADQTSGVTPNNFTSPVSYIVTAADSTSTTYTATVTVAPASSKAITSFSVLEIPGTINETAKTISMIVPYGTDMTALIASFVTTGTSVSVGSTAQESGETANNFKNPVPYVVTAADNSQATYNVIVTVRAVNLPRTGQTTSYKPGDDGDAQRGVAWPSRRFTIGTGAEAECMTDNLTGLMWEKTPAAPNKTWQVALDYADALDLCGYSDWRLPNRKELRSLVNYGKSNSALWLNSNGFNVMDLFYWSSSTVAPPYNIRTDYAQGVHMRTGVMTYAKKDDSYAVWAVRSGYQSAVAELPKTGQILSYDAGSVDDGALQKGAEWPSPRFSVGTGIEAECARDNLTGLMWVRSHISPVTLWGEAMDYADSLDICGFSDWRLPNVNELESLTIAVSWPTQWLNSQGFNIEPSWYWSSTTYAYTGSNAWCVNMGDGSVGIWDMTFSRFSTPNNYVCILAVRSGQ